MKEEWEAKKNNKTKRRIWEDKMWGDEGESIMMNKAQIHIGL